MIKVRFFGMIRLKLKVSSVEIEAGRIDRLLVEISKKYEGLSLKELKNSIIFVNGTNMINLNMLKTRLNDGDEVQVFSPAAGG